MKTIKSIAALLLCLCTMGLLSCSQKPKTYSFSASPSKEVVFAPGNLQYQASTNSWRFAANQYDIIGTGNNNISSTYNGWIDLFGWGTGDCPTKTSTKSSDYPSFTDWGINQIGEDAPGTWRTLTMDEWAYLLAIHDEAPARVGGIDGLMIFPQKFKSPSGITIDYFATNYKTNVYSLSEWEKLEALGVVFLPEAGNRFENFWFDQGGYYWSSSTNGHIDYEARQLFFYQSDYETYGSGYRRDAMAVRLVKDV